MIFTVTSRKVGCVRRISIAPISEHYSIAAGWCILYSSNHRRVCQLRMLLAANYAMIKFYCWATSIIMQLLWIYDLIGIPWLICLKIAFAFKRLHPTLRNKQTLRTAGKSLAALMFIYHPLLSFSWCTLNFTNGTRREETISLMLNACSRGPSEVVLDNLKLRLRTDRE